MVNLEKRDKIKKILFFSLAFIVFFKFTNMSKWFEKINPKQQNKIVYDENNNIREIHVNDKIHILNLDGTVKEIKSKL
jgi:hypothetical protein